MRDDPAARLALIARTYHGPTGRAATPALHPLCWVAGGDVADPRRSKPSLVGGKPESVVATGEGRRRPRLDVLLRATTTSIVDANLEHRDLAEAESASERFFMNVALVRVLYAHALVGAPRLALGRFAPLSRLLGDPRLGMAGVFSLRRVLPNRCPLALDAERYIVDEQRLGRLPTTR